MPPCQCPEAHLHVAPCSMPGMCHGPRHHAAAYLKTMAPEGIARALDKIAVEDGMAVEDVKEFLELGCAASTCPVTCNCACHICGPACWDFAIARRDARPTGALQSLFLSSPAGVLKSGKRRGLCDVGGDDASVSAASPDLLRRVASARCVGCVGCVGAERLAAGTPMQALDMAFRKTSGALLFDTLVFNDAWRAIYVPDADLLFAWPGDEEEEATFESYRGYVTFWKLYGIGYPFLCAAPDQRSLTISTLKSKCVRREASGAHEKKRPKIQTEDAAESLVDEAPRPTQTRFEPALALRLLVQHGARLHAGTHADSDSMRAEEVGRAFVAVGKVAERLAREGDVRGAADAFFELYATAALRHGVNR